METLQLPDIREEIAAIPKVMKAAVFVEPGRIELHDKPVPTIGPGEALVKVTTTTICGTDVYILKGEYPVEPGLIIGHEPVGVILRPLVTHRFALDQIEEAYDLFANQRDGVMKVAITT